MKDILIVLILLIVFSCTSGKYVNSKEEIIVFQNIECWLNLMPGGEPSFHYTGEIEVNNFNSEKILFQKIEFLSEEKSLNVSAPNIESSNTSSFDKKNSLMIIFHSPQKIHVTDDMLKTDFVDVKLTFSIDEKVIEIIKKDIQLLRTY